MNGQMQRVPCLELPFGSDEERWEAVKRRDPEADGAFVFSVATTGVYCRPSCPSRRARRENVAFHASCADAERAGFRPCKRCRPDASTAALRRTDAVVRACRLLEAAVEEPTLAELARAVGLSPYYFHRLFKATMGVTPKAYANACRARRARHELAGDDTVTTAIYAAGYNSSARFYAESPARLGMTPTRLRDGGVGTTIRFALGECSLGAILVAATTKGVCAIELGDDADVLLRAFERRFPKACLIGADAAFEQLVARVVGLIERPQCGVDLPLDIRGTAFQQRVWQALRAIGPGTTASYAEIARRIGQPTAVRAVAGACAANPVAVAIPCHRVVRTDGALSGYRWGVARKRILLEREAAG